MASLIVPERFARDKPGRRKVPNLFATMLKRRKSPAHKRYYGKVWNRRGEQLAYDPIAQHPGRKYGNTVSSWISDLVELRKCIVLCWRCKPKFYYKRAKYYRDEVFPYASGNCDGCRKTVVQGQLYLPEENLTDPGGMQRPGQCWTPH